MKLVVAYLITLLVFVAIDMVWLGFVAKSTYAAEMGQLVRTQVNFPAAIAFYLLYAGGLVFFAVWPALSGGGTFNQALWLGAALGLVAYGTYDLTNLAVINGFGPKIALLDLAWGTVLSGVSAALAFGITVKLA
jgi:uncharacterized membrane protein